MADSQTKYSADYSKRLSKCKRCKKEIAKGGARLAKVVPNFFAGGDNEDEMKQYYHIECMFESFQRARATTKIIEAVDDIEDYADLSKEDQKKVVESLDELVKIKSGKSKPKPKPVVVAKKPADSDTEELSDDEEEEATTKKPAIVKKKASTAVTKSSDSSDSEESDEKEDNQDDKLETFNEICDEIQSESSHLKKSAILKTFFTKGSSKSKLC